MFNTFNLFHLFKKARNKKLLETFVEDVFGVNCFGNIQQATTALQNAMEGLSPSDLKKLALTSEKINLLTGQFGQHAINNATQTSLTPEEYREFSIAGNEFDRSLWLYVNNKRAFNNALESRFQMNNYNLIPFSSYRTTAGLTPSSEKSIVDFCRKEISTLQRCNAHDVAIDISVGLDIDNLQDSTRIFFIYIHYNKLLTSVNSVDSGNVSLKPVKSAGYMYIVYDQSLGVAHIFSQDQKRDKIFSILYNTILNFGSIHHAPLQLSYNIRHFTKEPTFIIDDKNIKAVSVSALKFDFYGSKIKFEANPYSHENIYQTIKHALGMKLHAQQGVTVLKAKISVLLKADETWPERMVHIIVKNRNICIIKAKNCADKILCSKLLNKWNILEVPPFAVQQTT